MRALEYVVDVNILVRFLTGDDPRQFKEAKAIFEREEVWISRTVLLEADWVLRSVFSYTDKEIREAFASLIGIPTTHVEGGAVVQEALRLVEAGLDFADALHLAYRPAGTVFVSFDEKLVRSAQRAGVPNVVLAGKSPLN
jgi:predicted nucleic acid-binding protein